MFGLSTVAIRWLGGALLLVAVVFSIYYKGRLDERELFNKYKTEVKALAAAQEAKTQQIITQQNKITKKAGEQYAKDLAAIRNTYQRLRFTTTNSGIMPSIPEAAGSVDGKAAYYISIAPELASGCAETTAQLMALQNWILEQGE